VGLKAFARTRRSSLLARWRELSLAVYPDETVRFLRREKDRFQNPVGHVTSQALESLLDGLLDGGSTEEMERALDRIVSIRAVQDLSPSRALEFVFQLKRALREEVGQAVADDAGRAELTELEDGIDRIGLAAFDVFTRRRERVHELRSREIRRRAARLLERAELSFGAPEETESTTDGKGGSGA
jgi:hypothetical protein